MKKYVFISIATALLIISGCTEPKNEITLHDLRCENLTDPLGIGTTTPRLSWKIRSDNNGTSQNAYQILVASNKSLLEENDADLWNSGKILSSASIQVPYRGEELSSRSLCYWKVRIWDEDDVVSEWSLPSLFSVGLLSTSDWMADYIGFKGTKNNLISPLLRRSIDISDKGEKIFIHVNSLGYHELYLNGEKTGDKVLTPVVSQFNKRSLAITYDITDLITQGSNEIVIWIGHGWYSKGLPGVDYDVPLVKAQIEQLKNGNWETLVSTNSEWTGRSSGYSYHGTWRSGNYGGEQIDASLLLPDLSLSSLKKASWSPVFTAKDAYYNISPQTSESNRIQETIKVVTIQPAGDKAWLADMGKPISGWSEIKFPRLSKGQKITMRYSDHFDDKGNLANQGQENIYIASGVKEEIFRSKFNYHGFRYIHISNLEDAPSKENITASLIHTDFRDASSFECSDPDLNNIHDMIHYTLKCLSLGGYLVDCPQIERLGYGGDGNASTETAQTMFDLAPLYSNWMQAWADCIREDGGMPHTAPNPYPAGGGPYWCGFIITASWKTYQNYGDAAFLEKYYPEMQQWLGYVDKYSPAGLLEPWPETDYRAWYLGDWASPEGTDQTKKESVTLVNNCFIAVCYETMEKIAGVLGKTADIAEYEKKKNKLKELIHCELFNTNNKTYGSGSQIDLTYPLLADVVPDSLINDVKQNLFEEINTNNNGHIAAGLVGMPVFTEWAVKNKEADLMYSILKKRDYPGYLYMIDNGATTTWEHWNGARSRIHNCYNGIGSWFYQAVGGILPDENSPGYQHIIIDPQIPKGVTWAKTSKETPYGTVDVNWTTEDGIYRLDVKIPVGSSARIVIPEGGHNCKLNGKNIRGNKKFADIGSGNYNLICDLEK
jgi:alpha-L-rhamnosidase